MAWKPILIFLLLLLLLSPAFLKIEKAFRNGLSDKQNIVQLKPHTSQLVYYFALYTLVTFCLLILLYLLLSRVNFNVSVFVVPVLVLVFFLTVADLLLLLSHYYFSSKSAVFYKKASKTLVLGTGNRVSEISLTDVNLQVTEYMPWWHAGGRVPGSNFPVLVLKSGTDKLKLSGLIYPDKDFYLELLSHPNFRIRKRQFNFMI